jgi:hypothetical protein
MPLIALIMITTAFLLFPSAGRTQTPQTIQSFPVAQEPVQFYHTPGMPTTSGAPKTRAADGTDPRQPRPANAGTDSGRITDRVTDRIEVFEAPVVLPAPAPRP